MIDHAKVFSWNNHYFIFLKTTYVQAEQILMIHVACSKKYVCKFAMYVLHESRFQLFNRIQRWKNIYRYMHVQLTV